MPEVADRFDYHLEQSLRERLGAPVADPPFALTVRSERRDRDFNIARDRSVTRVQIEVRAQWVLRRVATDEIVRRGNAQVAAGYNSTASLFASRQVRRDVERRLAADLGERISLALLANGDAILEGQ